CQSGWNPLVAGDRRVRVRRGKNSFPRSEHSMSRLFGTDGVRGVANVPPMTTDMALEIGRATAHICKRQQQRRRPRILIGRDTRLSGDMIESALTAGICSMGVDALLVGPMPTPGIAFL